MANKEWLQKFEERIEEQSSLVRAFRAFGDNVPNLSRTERGRLSENLNALLRTKRELDRAVHELIHKAV